MALRQRPGVRLSSLRLLCPIGSRVHVLVYPQPQINKEEGAYEIGAHKVSMAQRSYRPLVTIPWRNDFFKNCYLKVSLFLIGHTISTISALHIISPHSKSFHSTLSIFCPCTPPSWSPRREEDLNPGLADVPSCGLNITPYFLVTLTLTSAPNGFRMSSMEASSATPPEPPLATLPLLELLELLPDPEEEDDEE